ncbi:acetyltransferase [bacterium]|nr:acetyltransferase [bacterium]
MYILGKSNNTISLILDSVYEVSKVQTGVTIVTNIFVENTPLFKLEASGVMNIEIIESKEWDKCNNRKILIGAIKAPTKKIIYDYFYKNHNIDEGNYSNLYHPKSVVSVQTVIGKGVFIGANSVLSPYVDIGNLVTINRGVNIGHHTSIGSFSTLNPGCNIAGGCRVGSYTTIGMGVNVIDGVNIGSNTIIGAGSTVVKSIPDNVIAYGSPAKVVRKNLPK